MRKTLAAFVFAAMWVFGGAASAAEHHVLMLNKGAKGAMVFEPDVVHAAPGDTIRFVPSDRTHNAETIVGMLPEGAEAFKGKINEEVAITVTSEGVYGIKCLPHYAMGMIMLIVVGEPVNLEEARAVKHPGVARKRFEQILAGVAGN